MAQIRKRGPHQYQARARLKGYPEITKTFDRKHEAAEGAFEQEKRLIRKCPA